MYEFLNMLDRKNLSYTKVFDKDSQLLRVEVSYPTRDNTGMTLYKLIQVYLEEHGMFMVYYRGLNLNKEPIKDYEVFRLLEAVMITDYGDRYDKASNSRIKQIEVRPINDVISNKYTFTIDGFDIGGVYES